MKIIPSIDVLDGQVVRLQMGDPLKKKVYGTLEQFLRIFEDSGVPRVHVVDLNSAFGRDDSSVWSQISEHSKLQFQVGGGIRSLALVEKYLETTTADLVLGSYLTSKTSEALSSLKAFPGKRLIATFDVALQDNRFIVKDHGWKNSTGKTLEEWLMVYSSIEFASILVTDIGRDGMMNGPNFNLYRLLTQQFPERDFIASGGVRDLNDLEDLVACGATRVVVGRSFYEGKLSLEEILCQV